MMCLDACPECVTNVEEPVVVEQVPGGTVQHYICTDCGYSWTTAWDEG